MTEIERMAKKYADDRETILSHAASYKGFIAGAEALLAEAKRLQFEYAEGHYPVVEVRLLESMFKELPELE